MPSPRNRETHEPKKPHPSTWPLICRRIFRFPVLRFAFQSSTSHLVIQIGWLTIPENLLDEKVYYKKWHETCFTNSERITSISPKVLPFGRLAFSNTFQPFIHTKSWTITKKSTNVYQQVQEKCSEKYKSTNLLILLQPSHGFFCFPWHSLLFQTPTPHLDQCSPHGTKAHEAPCADQRSSDKPCRSKDPTDTTPGGMIAADAVLNACSSEMVRYCLWKPLILNFWTVDFSVVWLHVLIFGIESTSADFQFPRFHVVHIQPLQNRSKWMKECKYRLDLLKDYPKIIPNYTGKLTPMPCRIRGLY